MKNLIKFIGIILLLVLLLEAGIYIHATYTYRNFRDSDTIVKTLIKAVQTDDLEAVFFQVCAEDMNFIREEMYPGFKRYWDRISQQDWKNAIIDEEASQLEPGVYVIRGITDNQNNKIKESIEISGSYRYTTLLNEIQIRCFSPNYNSTYTGPLYREPSIEKPSVPDQPKTFLN
jgi:hypothetical protein